MKIRYLETTRVPTTSLRFMVEVLEEEGLNADLLFHHDGPARAILSEPNRQISGLEELSFQRRFITLTGNRPDLWVRLGRRFRWLHYGQGGLAATTAPDLHHAARTLTNWSHLTYSLAVATPVWDDRGELIVGIEIELTEVPESLRAFTVYRDMGACATFFTEVLSMASPWLQFQCAYTEPSNVDLADELKARSIVYGSPYSGCSWTSADARLPLLNSEPILHRAYLEQCCEKEERLIGAGSFIGSVAAVLHDRAEAATIQEVADALSVSKRTLQRRMQEHGMTFHDLRGTILASRAREMLRNSNLSIAEIAWAVGYSEPTGFTHAFRRWTGLSPRVFRTGRARAELAQTS